MRRNRGSGPIDRTTWAASSEIANQISNDVAGKLDPLVAAFCEPGFGVVGNPIPGVEFRWETFNLLLLSVRKGDDDQPLRPVVQRLGLKGDVGGRLGHAGC